MLELERQKIFSRNLKAFMKEGNLSKAQFCRDIGISKPTLDKWLLDNENGTMPALANAILIAEKYNISIDELAGIEVTQSNNKNDEVDMVKKVFEAILFLKESLDIEIKNTVYYDEELAVRGFSVESGLITETTISTNQTAVCYFIQEYEKIQKIVSDPTYAEYRDSMLKKLFEKFKHFVYDKDNKTILLSNKRFFDIYKGEVTVNFVADDDPSFDSLDEPPF